MAQDMFRNKRAHWSGQTCRRTQPRAMHTEVLSPNVAAKTARPTFFSVENESLEGVKIATPLR